ncbi:MAG: recombinase family protein [Armatimonadetes bacterium]|nr:recombinase family protein [Armatimonadota bacterium]
MDNIEKVKQVGIWIRVSTEDQARGESPEIHERRARLYAESKGWQVREVYHLEAVSGKAVMHHPEARRMLEDIKKGNITGLIFSKLARLARNTKELLEFADIFRDNDADLISLYEAIDTSTPAGRFFYTMIAAMAQWEREEITDRINASISIRAKMGKPLGGQAPFGYCWEDKALVPDPTEAPVRKLVYELFTQHRRRKTVARVLNEMGHRTRTGAKFTDTTVTRLLRDPVAKGTKRNNHTTGRGATGKVSAKPEEEWIYTKVEPIISEELWDECSRILDTQEKKRTKPSRKTVNLFSGVTYCGCGGKMYVPSNSPKYTCLKCRNKIATGDLEEVFHEQLKAFYFSPKEIANYLNKANSVIKEKEELLNTLTSEEDKIKQEMSKVYNLYIDNLMNAKSFGEYYKPLEERLAQVADQIPEIQAGIDFLRIQYFSSDQLLHEGRDLYTRWPSLSENEKRAIIEHITEQITITNDEVTITLAYLPTSSELMAKEQRTPAVLPDAFSGYFD